MSLRQRCLGLVLTLSLFAPAIAGAQAPWTVTVTPTLNPLPIGFCGAVGLAIFDPTLGDTPRTPTGARVTIADFDMAVTSPDGKSVAGEQIDASHWSACSCQGATVGTVATITATYPAQSLAMASRVPGVAFQTTATFALGAAKGTSDPPACLTAAVALQPVAPPVTLAPAPAPAPAAPPTAIALAPVTLAPPVVLTVAPAPLTVVVRTELNLGGGSLLLNAGYCTRVGYDNPSILITDMAIVTGQLSSGGQNLRWTAAVSDGYLQITLCNNPGPAYLTIDLTNRKVNILVLR